MEVDAPDLLRFWFEFDLSGHEPPAALPGHVALDGGTLAYRLLWAGAGVTAYDEQDALALLADLAGEPLPPRTRTIIDPVISESLSRRSGNPAWRGVWHPARNLGGPAT